MLAGLGPLATKPRLPFGLCRVLGQPVLSQHPQILHPLGSHPVGSMHTPSHHPNSGTGGKIKKKNKATAGPKHPNPVLPGHSQSQQHHGRAGSLP